MKGSDAFRRLSSATLSGPKQLRQRVQFRNHFIATSGEFVGTTMFLFMAFAGNQAATANTSEKGTPQTIMMISLSYGISLLVNAWIWYRISGGLFNPAVTLGLVVAGKLAPLRGICLFPAQMLGGMVAAALVSCMLPGNINDVSSTLGAGTNVAQGLFIEMFLTSLLVISILMLAAEKTKASFLAPVGIGLTLFVCEIAGVFYTGGSLNPARSFGPALAGLKFPGYHWIYWVGPGLGALLSAGYFHFLKYFRYEEANPGQDADCVIVVDSAV